MSEYVVTGWKAKHSYKQTAASFIGAQVYCDDAKEKGFMDIRVRAPDGTFHTAAEVDKLVASGEFGEAEKSS